METKATDLTELFGSMVFNEDAMRQYLSSNSFSAWKECIENQTALDLAIANDIADAMKHWAIERGATHFTHWFQPMTGYTAEKHDSFITPAPGGKVLLEFSGKELVRGEPDASSFPSGGLRATFEARGYTAWDPTAYAFLRDNTLYIPTVFYSYSGQVLDKKTPLLRSMDEVSRQAVRILRLFGDTETKRVTAQVGPEQEYFLIDEKDFAKRMDLRMCGRTLFGASAPKGQELEDHYFGAIRPRVAAYMQDLDRELWKLGVLSKTKHNEVAPCQHEMAPIYTDANTACDHNQITMDVMKKVARKHGLVCLLHEKPFAGINGSGKHDNWSLATDSGDNLFKPGSTPSQNARFLLGDELTAVVESIIHGTEYSDPGKKSLRVGVDVMPPIPQDNTDRNRTSPMAFTGNKFEFRMLGSSQSIAGPNIALNTIMAEELEQFADELEGADDFNEALASLIRRVFTQHQRIIFNGNGYEDAWLQEAARRGLSNLTSTADALPIYTAEKNVALFTKHGIFTREEMEARREIHMENYCHVLSIEANTMADMIKRDILPAASAYAGELARRALGRAGSSACRYETTIESRISELTDGLLAACEKLEADLKGAPEAVEARLTYFHAVVFEDMTAARKLADQLETLVERKAWPFPTYSDMLFYM